MAGPDHHFIVISTKHIDPSRPRPSKHGADEGGEKFTANCEDAQKCMDGASVECKEYVPVPVFRRKGRSARRDRYPLEDVEHDRNTLRNYGRTPLIMDFVGERARPLPADSEHAYGGGSRATMRSVSQGHVALTPEIQTPLRPQEELPKQEITPRGNQITKKSEIDAGECGEKFAAYCEDARKSKDDERPEVKVNEPLVTQGGACELTQDVPPPKQEDCTKVPQFDASLNDSGTVQFDAYFDNLQETERTESCRSASDSHRSYKSYDAKVPKTGLCEAENERRLVNLDDSPKITQDTPAVTKASDEKEELQIDLSQDTASRFHLLLDISQDTTSFPDGVDSNDNFSSSGESLLFGVDLDGTKDSSKYRNYGRTPLIRDFVAERARPLPFDDEGAFGGGTRTRHDQRAVKLRVQTGTSSYGYSAALTSEFQPPVHPKDEFTHMQPYVSNNLGKYTEKVTEDAFSVEDTDAYSSESIWDLNKDGTGYKVDNVYQLYNSLPDFSNTNKESSPSSFAKELLETKLQELMVTKQKLEKYEKKYKKQTREYIMLIAHYKACTPQERHHRECSIPTSYLPPKPPGRNDAMLM